MGELPHDEIQTLPRMLPPPFISGHGFNFGVRIPRQPSDQPIDRLSSRPVKLNLVSSVPASREQMAGEKRVAATVTSVASRVAVVVMWWLGSAQNSSSGRRTAHQGGYGWVTSQMIQLRLTRWPSHPPPDNKAGLGRAGQGKAVRFAVRHGARRHGTRRRPLLIDDGLEAVVSCTIPEEAFLNPEAEVYSWRAGIGHRLLPAVGAKQSHRTRLRLRTGHWHSGSVHPPEVTVRLPVCLQGPTSNTRSAVRP